jgi:hypothetical protein
LRNAGLITEELGRLLPSYKGANIAKILGLTNLSQEVIKNEISIDVFALNNYYGSDINDAIREKICSNLVNNKQWYGANGGRYGFTAVKILGNSVAYGYLAQEYLDHNVLYDEEMNRSDEWPYRFTNTLFTWPIKGNVFILQDKRFHGAPTLDMSTTKNRILLIMQTALQSTGIIREQGVYFSPLPRTVKKEEMIQQLLQNKEQVTKTYIDIGKYRQGNVEETLPVFNPRVDLNENLTEIINEYEIPNVGNASFNSTKYGSLSKSKIVKAFALAGKINQITLGRGKTAKEIKNKVPTHVGRVYVSDPPEEQDIVKIIAFLQANLGISMGLPLYNLKDQNSQMGFEL